MFEKDLRHFRFWCNKVLPLVYDDALSYYEVLCKVTNKLNEVIEITNSIDDYIDDQIMERLTDEHLKEIIRTIFTNIKNTISPNDETGNTNASKDWTKGDFIWFDDVLYQTTKDIAQGVSFIFEGTNKNIDVVTLEKHTEMIYYPHDKKLLIHGKISDYSQIVTRGDFHIYDANAEAIRILKVE